MAYVKIFKYLLRIYVHANIVSETYKIQQIYLKKYMSRSRRPIFAVTTFDGKCKNLQMSPTHFFLQ